MRIFDKELHELTDKELEVAVIQVRVSRDMALREYDKDLAEIALETAKRRQA